MKRMIGFSLILTSIILLAACGESTRDIASVETFDSVDVAQFTPFDALGLPDEAVATLEDGEQIQIPVAWERARMRYGDDRPGEFTLEGDLITSGDVVNREDLKASITVRVQAEGMIATLEAAGGFTKLLNAIEAAGLEDYLSDSEDITLFAPNDDAFEDLLDLLEMDEDTLHGTEWLEETILYHVLPRRQTGSALSGFTPMNLDTVQGEAIRFDTANNVLQLNGTILTTGREIAADNGFIHEISGVLLPSDILLDIGSDTIPDDLQALIFELIASGDLPLNLFPFPGGGNDLSGVTLFAPEEEALMALASRVDMSIETLIQSEAFVDVLLYHVVTEPYLASELYGLAPGELGTLQGDMLSIEVVEDALKIGDASLISSESLFDIGYVHTIDTVLIPPSFADDWPDVFTEDE